jgi:hypothetical protein
VVSRRSQRRAFRAKTFYAFLAAITLFFGLLPLVLTGTASFGAAREECYARTVVRLTGLHLDVDSPQHDSNWNEGDNFDDHAGRHLFPIHGFNSISTVVSLFGFGVWLFFGPHNNSDAAQDLDRTLGSYFALQWLANVLVLASSLAVNCSNASATSAVALGILVNFFASFGLSSIGTNLLCHRYLCEKTRVMIKLCVRITLNAFRFQCASSLTVAPPPSPPPSPLHVLTRHSLDDTNGSSAHWLEKLEGPLVWEARSLCFVAVAAPFWFIYPPMAMVVGGFGALVIIVMVCPCLFFLWDVKGTCSQLANPSLVASDRHASGSPLPQAHTHVL